MNYNNINSTTVDERVVEMRIDNSKFEDGAKKTIGILEKLDKALHLHADTDEIDKLNRSIGNFDVSPMANGLNSLQSHFSALEIAGMRVISNLTDSVYNFATRTAKSLTIDQVTAGWSKYEKMTDSVQTIVAATRDQIGKINELTGEVIFTDQADQMAKINAQLDKMLWYTDETSYNFTDMVDNVGKFLAAGVGLDDAVTAMMGIASWGASAGAKPVAVSRAMYNISQAMGQGQMQLMDWRSIENANMATLEFKRNVLGVAKEMGILDEVMNSLDPDQRGYTIKIDTGRLEELEDGLTHIEDFSEKEQEGLITALNFREGLRDKWFTKDLMTEVFRRYGIFAEGLYEATQGTALEATNVLELLDEYRESIHNANRQVNWEGWSKEAGTTVEELQELIKALDEIGLEYSENGFRMAQEAKTFTDAIEATKDAVSSKWMKTFQYIFGDFLESKQFWTDVTEELYDTFAAAGDTRNEILEAWKYEGGGREALFGKWTEEIDGEIQHFQGAFWNLLDAIHSVTGPIHDALAEVFGWDTDSVRETGNALADFTWRVQAFTERLILSEEAQHTLHDFFKTVFSVLRFGLKIAGKVVQIGSQIFAFGKDAVDFILSIGRGPFNKISEFIGLFSDIIDIVLDGEGISGIINSLGEGFSLLLAPLAILIDIGDSIIGFFTGIFNKLSEFISFDQVISGLASSLQVFGMAVAGLIGAPLYAVFTVISNVFTAIKNGISTIYELAKSSEVVQSIISSIHTKLRNFYNLVMRLGNYISEGFKNGGFLEGLQAFWTGLKIELRTSLPTLYGVLSNIFGLFSSSWSLISNAFTSLTNGFNTEALQGFFDGTLSFFQALPQFLGNGMKGIGGLFAVIFGGIAQLVTGIINSFKGAKLNIDTIEESFGHFYETIQFVFNNVFGDPTELKERIKNFMLETWSGFKEAVSQISIMDAFKAFRAATLLAIVAKIASVLGSIKRISDEAASIPEAIAGAIGRGGRVFDDIGRSFRANTMIKLASSLVMVAMALWGLSRIHEDKLTHAAGVASLVMVIMAIVANSINKNRAFQNVDIKQFRVFDTVGSALIGLGVAIAAFAFAVLKLEKVASSETFKYAVIAIIALIATISAIVYIFAKSFTSSNMNWERLKAVGTIISKLGGAIFAVALSVGLLVIPVLAFTAAAVLLQKQGLDSNFVWIAALTVGALIVTIGLLVGMLMGSLAGLRDEQVKYIGGAMLKIAGSVYILAAALGRFIRPLLILTLVATAMYDQKQDLKPLGAAFGIFLVAFLALAVFIAGLAAIVGRGKNMTDTRIKALGTSMLQIGGAVALIGIGMKKLINSMLAIAVVTSVLKHLKMDADIGAALDVMTKMAVGLTAVLFALAVVSAMPGLDFKKLLGIAAVITALGLAMLFLTPAIIGLGLVIGVFVAFLSTLENATEVISRMKSVAIIIAVLAVAAAALGAALLWAGKGAVRIALGFGLIAVGIFALAAALTLLGEHQDSIVKFFKRLMGFFKPANTMTIMAFIAMLGVFLSLVMFLSRWLVVLAKGLKLITGNDTLGKKLGRDFNSIKTNLLSGVKNIFTSARNYLTDPKNINVITAAIGGVITTVGLYLAGVIPTFTETVVVSLVQMVSSLSASIMAHREEFSQAISDAVNTIFSIAGDVVKDVFFNGESWKEGRFGGALLRILLGALVIAKFLQALTSIAKSVGGLFGKTFGKKAAANIAANVVGGATEKAAVEAAAEGLGAAAGAAAKTGFLASFGTIAGLIAAEVAAVGGGMWLRHVSDKKVAETGLTNLVTEQTEQGLTEIEAYINTINDLLNAKVLITNIASEDIDDQDMDRALRRNNEALKIAYDNLAAALGITTQELKEQIALYGSVSDAVDANLQKHKEIEETLAQEKKTAEEAQAALQDAENGEIKIESEISLDEASYSLLDSLQELWAGLGESASLFGGDLQGTLQGIIDRIVASAREQYPDLTREGLIQKVTEGLNSYTSNIGLDLSQFGDVSGMITSAIDKAIPQVSEITNKASDVVSRMVIVSDELGEMQDELEASIKHLHSRRKRVGEGSVTAVAGPLVESLMRDENTDAAYVFSQLASSSPVERKARNELTSLIKQIDSENIAEGLTGLYNDIQKNIETYTSRARVFYHAYERFLKSDEYLSALALDDDGQLSEQLIMANGNFDKYLEEIDNAAYNFAQLQALQETLNSILVECAEEYKQAEQYYNELSADPNADSNELENAYNHLQTSIQYYNEIKEIMDGLDLDTELSLFDENSPILSLQKAENNPELDEATKSLAQKIQNGISTGLTENSSVVDEGANNAVVSLLENLQSAWAAKSPEELFNQLAKAIPDGIVNAIKQNSSDVVNAIVTLIQHMQVPFQNIQSRFQNFGVQAVRGVVIGINSNVNAAYNAGVNLANAVNRGYTDTLKINSPSRVFEELSAYIPMGAANGIMKGIPIAVAAASDLANAIVDEAAYTMSNMAYVASDQYDFSPKITPVIDLNGAYNGMDRLESILADNPVSMSIRTNPSQRRMPQNATNYTLTNQNKDVVMEIQRLNDMMGRLGQKITDMQLVLDTGVLVGQLAPGLNSELGVLAMREGRQ